MDAVRHLKIMNENWNRGKYQNEVNTLVCKKTICVMSMVAIMQGIQILSLMERSDIIADFFFALQIIPALIAKRYEVTVESEDDKEDDDGACSANAQEEFEEARKNKESNDDEEDGS